MAAPAGALRHSASPWTLLHTAVGGADEIAGKLQRLGRTLRLWTDGAELERRLRTLEQRGRSGPPPSRLQLLFGGLDMLRFLIEPAARDYYRAQGICFGFHQLLRVLDDPVSMVDPTGFLSDRDTIVGHLMQVVHLNPVYDVQLLEMFPDGLEDLEEQVAAMVEGTHPRHGTIGAIVEDPAYHARLLDYVRAYRRDPGAVAPVRPQATVRSDPGFAAAEDTFAELPGYLAYCRSLPTALPALLLRLLRVRHFPVPDPARPAG